VRDGGPKYDTSIFPSDAGTLTMSHPKLLLLIALFVFQVSRVQADEAGKADQTPAVGVLKVTAKPVRTDLGVLRGLVIGDADDVQAYRGIPYAAPPVGSLRWRPPQPAHEWQGIRECFDFAPAAPQKSNALVTMFPGMALRAPIGEDCLYLNVWAPTRPSTRPRPVMVWIHGGGYLFGAGSQGLYDGANLARRGVVVVSMNYRLGPLGFLAHPQLSAESGHGSSGNYGLLDQIEALRWIQRNIAAFGGDPTRVTIFGESAGGGSVMSLVLSPLAKDLFHRAIAESSGSLHFMHAKRSHYGFRSAERMGIEFAHRCGAPPGPGQLAALRGMSADQLLQVAAGSGRGPSIAFKGDGWWLSPIVDGWVIPDDPLALLERGKINKVPLIVGANADEGSMFAVGPDLPKGRDEFSKLLESEFGIPMADRLGKLYRGDSVRQDVADLMGDFKFVAPARFAARTATRAGVTTYLYHFAHPSPGPLGKTLGAHHGLEIAYVMDNLQLAPSRSSVDDSIRDTLVRHWVRFASTGDPNREGLPPWPAYEAAGDSCLLVQDTIIATHGLRRARLDAIDALIDAWRSETGMSAGAPRAAGSAHSSTSRPAASTTPRSAPKPTVQKPASSVVRTKPTPPATKAPSPPAAPRVDVASTTTRSAPKPTVQKPARSVVRTKPTATPPREPRPPAMPHVAAASTPTDSHSVPKLTAREPASSVRSTIPTPSKATLPPVQHLDVVSASGSATVTTRKISPPQPAPTNPQPPRSLQDEPANVTKTSSIDASTPPRDPAIDSRRPTPLVPQSSSRVDQSLKLAKGDREAEIRYARFLIKAGLANVAVESLRKIVAESPGTRAAQEAQQILDSIAKTSTKARPPAALHAAAASPTTHPVSKSTDQRPASSVLSTIATPSKATHPPVRYLDVVSASGSATVTARKISSPQPPRTSALSPPVLRPVDAGTVPSTATTSLNSMQPILDRPIEQQPLPESRFVTAATHRVDLGLKPEPYDPQGRIDLENARYWIERKHKNWARGLLVKYIVDHPASERAETARRMLEELDQ
jgi:para-nitrobenzyl esterase